MFEDTYKHKGQRKSLIKELEFKGINNPKVLSAISEIPRHFFLDKAFEEHAYLDKAFPIGNGQTISQPFTVAQQTSLLNIKHSDKVLEIGTGCGYQTAVLSKLCKNITSIERIEQLNLKAKKNLSKLKIPNVKLILGDGTLGHPKSAPFDKIIVTAGAPVLPQNLFSQLAINGQIVIPIGNDKSQTMFRFTKTHETKVLKENFGDCAFVPLIGNQGWEF